MVMGAYGNTCDPRPRFVNPGGVGFLARYESSASIPKHLLWLSLHLDGHDRTMGSGSYGAVTFLTGTG